MKTRKEFIIPIKGLGEHLYRYSFLVGSEFFKSFENEDYSTADIKVDLILSKQTNMIYADFFVSGVIATSCDRCLADIKLPISGEHNLIIKFKESEQQSEDPAVVFMSPLTNEIDFSTFVYEYILLSIPLQKIYACEEEAIEPCDTEVLKKLEDQEDDQEEGDSIWDSLKNLNIN